MSVARPGITKIEPSAGIAGGEIKIECSQFTATKGGESQVLFGSTPGRMLSASPKHIVAVVPDGLQSDDLNSGIRLSVDNRLSEPAPFHVGEKIASELHPVANPAIDPDNGSIYVTLSGTRGQKVPISIYRIFPDGDVRPFVSDITNPTSMAIDSNGQLFVSSRFDGIVYKVSSIGESEAFAQNLGAATGIAFNRRGDLYVGDRNGIIYRINGIGEAFPFTTLEASVAAFHLAFGPDDYLYVTGPTVHSYEPVYRISPLGDVEPWCYGFGRPQGLAFDTDGNLYVAASRRGHRGIFRITPEKEISMVAAGMSIVGLALDFKGDAIITTQSEVHRLPLGIKSLLLER